MRNCFSGISFEVPKKCAIVEGDVETLQSFDFEVVLCIIPMRISLII